VNRTDLVGSALTSLGVAAKTSIGPRLGTTSRDGIDSITRKEWPGLANQRCRAMSAEAIQAAARQTRVQPCDPKRRNLAAAGPRRP
jgi:hypothetical protein